MQLPSVSKVDRYIDIVFFFLFEWKLERMGKNFQRKKPKREGSEKWEKPLFKYVLILKSHPKVGAKPLLK